MKQKNAPNGMSLGSKVVIFISVLIFLILANVVTSYILASKINSQVSDIKSKDLRYMLAAEKAYSSFMAMDDNTLFLTAAPKNTDSQLINITKDAIEKANNDLNDAVKELLTVSPDFPMSEQKDIASVAKAAGNYITFNKTVLDSYESDSSKGYYHMYQTDEESNVFFPLSDSLTKLKVNAEKNINQHAESAISFGSLQNLIVGILGFVSLLVGVGVAFFIRRSINPLKLVAQKIKSMGEGDFSQGDIVIKSSDEIGQIAEATNSMKNNLRNVIEMVGLNAEQVAASSEQLSASSEQTTQATKYIANTMEEFSAGTEGQAQNTKLGLHLIQEMADKLEQVSDHAQGSAVATEQATIIADKGQASIEQAMQQMNSMNNTTQSLSEIIKDLGDHSSEIGQIVNVIQSITSQTNLLALNAAIEAARAGEYGRGFAVVADEVRKLAEQSNQSTEKVLELVTTIQTKTNEAVQAAELTNQEMSTGMESVSTANKAFESIHQSVSVVGQRIKDVAGSVAEMTAQSKQIVESILSISEVAVTTSQGTQNVSSSTREQLGAMEEITAAALSLSRLSEELLKVVSNFRI